MKRYTYSKFIKATGQLLEGRAFSKTKALQRFKQVVAAFKKRKMLGLFEVNTFGNEGKVYTRKKLVTSYLARLEKEEKDSAGRK